MGPAGRRYEDLIGAGRVMRVAALAEIIASKEWADRPKLHEALPEVRRLADNDRSRPPPGVDRATGVSTWDWEPPPATRLVAYSARPRRVHTAPPSPGTMAAVPVIDMAALRPDAQQVALVVGVVARRFGQRGGTVSRSAPPGGHGSRSAAGLERSGHFHPADRRGLGALSTPDPGHPGGSAGRRTL